MSQIVYDNIIAIFWVLVAIVGACFGVFYGYKRSQERSKQNELDIQKLKKHDDLIEKAIAEMQKTNALIEQQIKSHESICLDHKERLEKHLDRIYDLLRINLSQNQPKG